MSEHGIGQSVKAILGIGTKAQAGVVHAEPEEAPAWGPSSPSAPTRCPTCGGVAHEVLFGQHRGRDEGCVIVVRPTLVGVRPGEQPVLARMVGRCVA
jgi:hypothetical protein